PSRLDLAWRSIEPNTFGLAEFMEWTRLAGVEPMLAVNLGTRGVQEAADLLEYANYPKGTQLSELRRQHGQAEPFDVRLWCLGNEMDGPWQIGRKDAREYGRLAAETAKAMRLVDPRVELVACGSSNRQMPTFGSWEATVLDEAYDHVDYISLHAYYEQHADDLASFLATSVDMDGFINDVVATCDHVRAKRRSKKTMRLSFDEWNVWYQSRFDGAQNQSWDDAPRLIEDDYTAADAVALGGYLITLLNHADRVAIACQAQLVNVIAPIRTEPGGPAWRQSIFYPFAHTARLARGKALQVSLRSPEHHTAEYGGVESITAAASYDESTGGLSLFIVNRCTTDAIDVEVDLRGLPGLRVAEHQMIHDNDPTARNRADAPDRVTSQLTEGAVVDGDRLAFTAPAISWTALTLRPEAHP
ncbi:MAG TPA: alpha-L-arabinofuranosidase C-terminal domain-containing protein, partial [Acidothermaceae bacterium]